MLTQELWGDVYCQFAEAGETANASWVFYSYLRLFFSFVAKKRLINFRGGGLGSLDVGIGGGRKTCKIQSKAQYLTKLQSVSWMLHNNIP